MQHISESSKKSCIIIHSYELCDCSLPLAHIPTWSQIHLWRPLPVSSRWWYNIMADNYQNIWNSYHGEKTDCQERLTVFSHKQRSKSLEGSRSLKNWATYGTKYPFKESYIM
jgi:hypothetical protein